MYSYDKLTSALLIYPLADTPKSLANNLLHIDNNPSIFVVNMNDTLRDAF